MNINLENRLYKIEDRVYIGYNQINVHNQRGRLFVKIKGRQVNIKDIPKLPEVENDCVYNYIFKGWFRDYPCPAMDFWIYRHRLGNRISITDYKNKFKVKVIGANNRGGLLTKLK